MDQQLDPARATAPAPGPFHPANFIFIPIAEAVKPISGRPRVWVDFYWLIDDQDRIAWYNPLDPRTRGRQVLGGRGSAQANSSPGIYDLQGHRYPWCVGERQIPVVFRPAGGWA